MKGRHAASGVALLIASVALLSACSSVAQTDAGDASSSTDTDTIDTNALGPIDAATLDSLTQRKAEFDDWMFDWRDAGCDAERASNGDLNCAGQLSAGHLVTTAVAIEFGSLPDFGMGDQATERIAAVAEAAEASGIEWVDGECPGEVNPSCEALTKTFVGDLEVLHEELLRWTH